MQRASKNLFSDVLELFLPEFYFHLVQNSSQYNLSKSTGINHQWEVSQDFDKFFDTNINFPEKWFVSRP